jgi:phasin family protein
MANNFDDFQKFGKEQFEAATTALTSLTKGFQTIAAETTEFSKRSLEDGSVYVEKLCRANSLDSAVQIQSEFAKTSYEGLVAQMNKMTELYSALAREAFRPVERAMAKAQSAAE